jgi:cytochrome c biogenesis protein CcmG, thiol:disulfide interchange protein DsbE
MTSRFGALCVAAGLALFGCEGVPDRVEVGRPAPEYAATTLDGQPVQLIDLRGRVVLLNVWATWCAPCREEIPELQALHDRHSADGLEVVGVSVDGRTEAENIRRFAAELDMTYPIWHDPEDVVGTRFRTIGVPTTFLIDRDGVIVWRHMGPVRADDPTLTEALQLALATG